MRLHTPQCVGLSPQQRLSQRQTWLVWSTSCWDTHQCALKVKGVGENHVGLPVLDFKKAGALGGAAILCGRLFSRGRGLEERRKDGTLDRVLRALENCLHWDREKSCSSWNLPESPSICTDRRTHSPRMTRARWLGTWSLRLCRRHCGKVFGVLFCTEGLKGSLSGV